jgi:hypothetical protein
MIPSGKPYVSCLSKVYYSKEISAEGRNVALYCNTKFGRSPPIQARRLPCAPAFCRVESETTAEKVKRWGMGWNKDSFRVHVSPAFLKMKLKSGRPF